MCVRGEWEAELGKGRRIVVHSSGGFPRSVAQTHHVTHPERATAEGGRAP